MKYVLALLVLFYATPSKAECYRPVYINELAIAHGYNYTSPSKVNGIPARLYYNPIGLWMIVTYDSPIAWCVVARGYRYKSIVWRKA